MTLSRRQFVSTFAAFTATKGWTQVAPPHIPASSIPDAALIQPDAFAASLKTESSKPVILQVGPQVMFAQAHIAGAEYAGQAGKESGLQALRDRISTLPKSTTIVLYCGCCPWSRCPNVAPAYKLLHDQGFSQVKVISIADNFGNDWVAKGFPIEEGQ